MAKRFQNYIQGEWVDSSDGNTFTQRNPANLDDVTGEWPASTRRDAQRAVEAAKEAFPAWSRLTPFQRGEILKRAHAAMRQRREELAEVLTMENGKTLGESKVEIDAAMREMEFQIHEGLRLGGQTVSSSLDGVMAYSVRQPLGVVTIISPWNFPFNVPGRKCTPALMAGNTCVFKPASLTPQTGQKFVNLFVEAGLPAGVLNLVTGSGSTVGEELVTHPSIQAVSFTGSTEVGRAIHQKAAQRLTRTQLEMGGKNPLVVLADADLEEAAQATATAAYACAGQWCTSTSRVIVLKSIAAEFVDRVAEFARKIVVGDGRESRTTMGPVCGPQQLKLIQGYIEKGKEEGAHLLLGGHRLTEEPYAKGCFLEPTIFTEVTPTMVIAQEEIFGPVLSVIEAEDFDEALEIANQVEFGLSSSIYTKDLQSALTFLERTEVGLTHVNLLTSLKEPQLSFGGIKASGFGIPEGGQTGIEFFTEHKVAYVKFR